MTLPSKDEIFTSFFSLIQDSVLQYIECDELTGQLIEEAILEALEDNASYFAARSEKAMRILHEYKAVKTPKKPQDFKRFAECDI